MPKQRVVLLAFTIAVAILCFAGEEFVRHTDDARRDGSHQRVGLAVPGLGPQGGTSAPSEGGAPQVVGIGKPDGRVAQVEERPGSELSDDLGATDAGLRLPESSPAGKQDFASSVPAQEAEQLQATWEREVTSPEKTRELIQHLNEAVATLSFAGKGRSVECRETLCRVEQDLDSVAQGQELLDAALRSDEVVRVTSIRTEGGEVTATAFVLATESPRDVADP